MAFETFSDGEALSSVRSKINANFGKTVEKETGKGLSSNDFTTGEKNKLSSLSNQFKGYFLSLAALSLAFPTGTAGDYAIIRKSGQPDSQALWDTDDSEWVDTFEAPAGVDQAYVDGKAAEATSAAITQLRDGVVSAGDTLAKQYALIVALQALVTDTTPDGDALVNRIQEVLAILSDYPEGASVLQALNDRVKIADLVNNLLETSSGKALDARQGKVLKDLLDTLTTTVAGKASATMTTSAISGSYELTSADSGKVLKHTGTGTLSKNANFTTGMWVDIAKQDGNTLTIGFTLEAFGSNVGTKLDGDNPSVRLIQNASTVTRIGELTV